MTLKSNPQYRKNPATANSTDPPRAAAHVGAAVIELRRQAADEMAGGIAGRLLQFADTLHQLVRPLEKLEETLALERLAGTEGEWR